MTECNIISCQHHDTDHVGNCKQCDPVTCPDFQRFNAVGQDDGKLDMVNHPKHYGRYGIEVIDMIRDILGKDGFRAYCLGNILKYRMRAGVKGDMAEDIAKAEKYLEFMEEAK